MKHREFRWPCEGNIRLKTTGGEFSGALVNISRTGVRFSTERRLSAGQEVAILVLSKNFSASVVWSKGAIVGAKFAAPLGAAEFAIFSKSLMRKSTGARPPVTPRGAHGFRELR